MTIGVANFLQVVVAFSSGFHTDGRYQVMAAIDNWEAAKRVYSENFPDTGYWIFDLSDSSSRNRVIRELKRQLRLGDWGASCQGFSTLGKRRDGDDRSTLVDCFVDAVKKIKPKFVLVENVKGIESKSHPSGGTYADRLRDRLAVGRTAGSYDFTSMVINCLDYEIAQTRVRWIGFGVRRDLQDRTDIMRGFYNSLARKKGNVTRSLRDAIGDLPSVGPGQEYKHSQNEVPIFNHRSMNHGPDLIERFSHVPPGGGLFDVPEDLLTPHLRKMKQGAYGSGGHVKNIYGRMDWEKPSGTIVAGIDKITCGRFVHPVENRLLTPRECARIQSFPDDFVFQGSLVTQYYLIGNAVPPRLSQVLASALSETIADVPIGNTTSRAA